MRPYRLPGSPGISLDLIGSAWTCLGLTGSPSTALDIPGPHWAFLDPPEPLVGRGGTRQGRARGPYGPEEARRSQGRRGSQGLHEGLSKIVFAGLSKAFKSRPFVESGVIEATSRYVKSYHVNFLASFVFCERVRKVLAPSR